MFASRIGAPSSASCSSWARVWVRTVPRVPTGMNTGVAIASRAVVSVAARAREPATVAWTVNCTLFML